MRKLFKSVVCVFWFISSLKAQKSYDIFTYKVPSGFIQTSRTGTVLALEKNEGKNYCQLALYASTEAQSDTELDFVKNWDYFARNPEQGITDPESRDTGSNNKWQMLFGAARGKYNGQMFALTMGSFSRNGINYCIGAVFTDSKFIPIIQEFMAGVVADEAKFTSVKKQPTPNTDKAGGSTNATSNSTGKGNGIARPTLTFNDGWTSTAYNDFVAIVNNICEVRLIFPDPAIDGKRPENTSIFEPYYWDNVVRKYYRVTGQVVVREKPLYSYGEFDIWMAPASNLVTGKNGYLSMIRSNNGTASVVTVFAPSREYLEANFSKTADYVRMFGYNKFYATKGDLIGQWKNSSGAGIEYYNVYTGASAGMATSHVSDNFVFSADGTYKSEHTGTSTFQGSVAHGKSSYTGVYSLNDVTLTATGRGTDDPGEFICYFEAVKMGFMLRLTHKKYSGNGMLLYKVQ